MKEIPANEVMLWKLKMHLQKLTIKESENLGGKANNAISKQ